MTATIFVVLGVITSIFVEDILDNGYSLLAGSNLNTVTELVYGDTSTDDIANEIDATCDIDGSSWDDGFIWVNYDMDVPGLLTSGTYNYFDGLGIVLGWIEVLIILRIACCLDERLFENEQEDEPQTDEDLPLRDLN